MMVTYDRQADAVYVHLHGVNHRIDRTQELDDGRNIDYVGDMPVGIEFLNVSLGLRVDGLPDADEVAALLRDDHMTRHLTVERVPGNDADQGHWDTLARPRHASLQAR